jgi:catechol 2,3-dioxygenase-like lactoylglutathione lyase family enzyme
MITGTHAIIYAHDADRARAFFRDVLGMSNVDAHGGWLIFKLPPAELGIHPAAAGSEGEAGAAGSGRHEVYLMCDDIEATVAELSARGAEFTEPVADRGFGLLTTMRVPGGGELGLYQPKHPTAHDLDG